MNESRLAATVAVGFTANEANVLVFDVIPSTSAQSDRPGQGPRAFAVSFALPQARQAEFASATALLQLARRL